jgi:hypothetical protein
MSNTSENYIGVFENLAEAEKIYLEFVVGHDPIKAMMAFRKQEAAMIELLEGLGIAEEYENFKYTLKANKERG